MQEPMAYYFGGKQGSSQDECANMQYWRTRASRRDRRSRGKHRVVMYHRGPRAHTTHKRTSTSTYFPVKIDYYCTMIQRSSTTQPSKVQQTTQQQTTANHNTASIGLNMSGTAVRSCAIVMPNPGTSPTRRYLHVST